MCRNLYLATWVAIAVLAPTAFSASNETDLGNELPTEVDDDWVVPELIAKEFPYYVSGYDMDGRPVIALECGRYDFRKKVEAGGTELANLHKHLLKIVKMIKRIPKRENKWQHAENGTDIDGAILILDMDMFSNSQLASSKTVLYMIRLARIFTSIQDFVARAYFINVNFAAQTILNVVIPIFGSFFEKIEIHGTNNARWIPALLQNIPKDQLPPWYGGTKDFKPVVSYG